MNSDFQIKEYLSAIPEMMGRCNSSKIGDYSSINEFWAPRQGAKVAPGIEYFGVAIKTDYLRRHLLKTMRYGVIDSWETHWPILKAPKSSWRDKLNDVILESSTSA